MELVATQTWTRLQTASARAILKKEREGQRNWESWEESWGIARGVAQLSISTAFYFFFFFPSFFFFFGEEGSSVVGGGHVTQMFPSTGETFVVLRLSIPDLSAGAGSSVCCSEGLVLPGSPQAEDIPQGCGRRLGAAWVTTVSTQSPEVCQLLLTVTVPVLSLPSSLIVFQHREVLLFPT